MKKAWRWLKFQIRGQTLTFIWDTDFITPKEINGVRRAEMFPSTDGLGITLRFYGLFGSIRDEVRWGPRSILLRGSINDMNKPHP